MRVMPEPYAISFSDGDRRAGGIVNCDFGVVEEFFVDHSSDA